MNEYIYLFAASIVIGLVISGVGHLVPTKSYLVNYVTNVVTALLVAATVLYFNSKPLAEEIIAGAAPF